MTELKATTAQEIVRIEKDCDYMDELFGGVKMPPTQVYLKSDVDKVLAEKDEEIRRLRRALWVTRTAMAKSEKDRWNTHIDCGTRRNRKDPAFIKTGKLLEVSEWRKLWADNERKCLNKAEEYK